MSMSLPEYVDAALPPQDGGETRPRLDSGVLGVQLGSELKTAINARGLYELRWLDDLRQYKGIYPPHIAQELRDSRRSQVFYRLTTFKVNTTVARLMDLLFPQRSKNWSIRPTPDPDVPQDILLDELHDEIAAAVQEEMAPALHEMAAAGVQPDEMLLQRLQAEAMQDVLQRFDTPENRQKVATDRAARMENLIDDALKENSANGRRRPSWTQNCRAVVHDCCLHGMGILKGPLVEKVRTTRFVRRRDESGRPMWSEQAQEEKLRPYHEAVSIWDVFPDPDARNAGELRFVWQSHLMTDKDLLELTSFPGFNAAAIERYMRDHEDGDAMLYSWEASLRELDRDRNGGEELRKRYRVWERWGFLTGKELADAGADIPQEQHQAVYSSNVWMLGDDIIIKAMANPLEGVDIPYYWYPYQEDASSFWPEGVASLLRHPQSAINAAVRAMQDNMAFSAQPFIAINMQALSPKDGRDIRAAISRKVLCFDRANVTLQQAFQALTVPSCTNENLAQKEFWAQAADEISTPRFNAGDGSIKGAGETASGLSMLMGASNVLLKDHIKLFDDCIVAPFLRAMFRWMMQWSDREDCKGDFEIVPTGSQSLVAKEVRAQQIPTIMPWLSVPELADNINKRGLLEVAMEQTDLPTERILFTEEDAKRNAHERQLQQAQANLEAMMQELQRQGLTPEQIQQQILLLLTQMSAAQGPQPPAARPQPEPPQGVPA